MSTKIYIGFDPLGEIKHVGEVKSGLECACVCIICKAPLIARQGQVNVWHFAHEGGQTHVNCEVGARNYLRHLACEVLLANYGRMPAPQSLRGRNSMLEGMRSEQDAIASLDLVKALEIDKIGPATVVARGQTKRGKWPFSVYVVIGQDPLPTIPDEARTVLLVEVPVVAPSYMTQRVKTIEELRRGMTLSWLRVEMEVQRQVDGQARWFDDYSSNGRPWEGSLPMPNVANEQLKRRELVLSRSPIARPTAFLQQMTNVKSVEGTEPPTWVNWLKPQASMFCYRFKDGSFWLLGQIDPSMQYWAPSTRWLLRQWPYPAQGWDEKLSPSCGVAHVLFEGYVSSDPLLLQHLSQMIDRLLNTYDPREVHQEFLKLGWRE